MILVKATISRKRSGDKVNDISKGSLVAIAIVLLWLAGVGFWIAFTGATGETIGTTDKSKTGVGTLKSMISDVTEQNAG